MGFWENGLNERKKEAEIVLRDEDKLDHFLTRLQTKLKVIPKVGDGLSKIPLLVSLLRSYAKGKYTEIPMGTILSLTACLIYFASTIDIIPDFLPFMGFLDDAAVLAVCWKWISTDVEEYEKWRIQNSKEEGAEDGSLVPAEE